MYHFRYPKTRPLVESASVGCNSEKLARLKKQDEELLSQLQSSSFCSRRRGKPPIPH
jgi:hypothetical protein